MCLQFTDSFAPGPFVHVDYARHLVLSVCDVKVAHQIEGKVAKRHCMRDLFQDARQKYMM